MFNGTYRRNGEGDYHCSRETVEGMIRDKCAETADNCILDELTIADLDADTIWLKSTGEIGVLGRKPA